MPATTNPIGGRPAEQGRQIEEITLEPYARPELGRETSQDHNAANPFVVHQLLSPELLLYWCMTLSELHPRDRASLAAQNGTSYQREEVQALMRRLNLIFPDSTQESNSAGKALVRRPPQGIIDILNDPSNGDGTTTDILELRNYMMVSSKIPTYCDTGARCCLCCLCCIPSGACDQSARNASLLRTAMFHVTDLLKQMLPPPSLANSSW